MRKPADLAALATRAAGAFCKAQEGWRIVAHKQDQATGTKLDRPGLQPRSISRGPERSNLLLVYRVDRLSRKYASSRN